MLLLLIIWPIFIFILMAFIMLPLQFTVKSIFEILTIPNEIVRIASNRRLRQNHALEHATINVIEEYYGHPLTLSGLAKEDGFFIRGPIDINTVEEAAYIGLMRLKRGERYLAINSKCGTSLTMVNFISSLAFLALLLFTGHFNFLNILISLFIANLLGPIFGKVAQKYLTTNPNITGIDIAGIEACASKYWIRNIYSNASVNEYFIRTRQTDLWL